MVDYIYVLRWRDDEKPEPSEIGNEEFGADYAIQVHAIEGTVITN